MAVDLIVVHGISLPPGQFGGPWIDALFTNTLDPDAHPYFRTIADLRVSAHLLIRRDGDLAQYVSFQRRAWHAGASSFAGRSAATTSASASSWKAPIIFLTTTASTRGWPRSSPRCERPIPPWRPTGWSVTPTSRRAVKPIRDRHSTGRGCVGCWATRTDRPPFRPMEGRVAGARPRRATSALDFQREAPLGVSNRARIISTRSRLTPKS